MGTRGPGSGLTVIGHLGRALTAGRRREPTGPPYLLRRWRDHVQLLPRVSPARQSSYRASGQVVEVDLLFGLRVQVGLHQAVNFVWICVGSLLTREAHKIREPDVTCRRQRLALPTSGNRLA